MHDEQAGPYLKTAWRPGDSPRTNKQHERFYKQLKDLLRKVISFGVASSFLLGHGERIIDVMIDELAENIREIFFRMDLMKAR